MADDSSGPKVYIHEFIDIIGPNRAKYFQHMTANWSPIGQAERDQLCFGVWGTVGSTGRWPEVVNLWELDGWEGLAANFDHELSSPSLQDPALAEWWKVAADLRRGGFDRILVPEPWSPTITELTDRGVRGAVYAHELVTLAPGRADEFLALLGEKGRTAIEALGLTLVGAYRVAMMSDTEAIVIWAIPDWATWVAFERAHEHGGALRSWRDTVVALDARVHRILLVDAPLSPMRTGRQPRESDRRPLSEIG
ncbi:MAG: hypothetical protein JWL73_3224 [Actinomycetia bacterium]|nr:hypothetical protein [Actinomycetes bacterium]